MGIVLEIRWSMLIEMGWLHLFDAQWDDLIYTDNQNNMFILFQN